MPTVKGWRLDPDLSAFLTVFYILFFGSFTAARLILSLWPLLSPVWYKIYFLVDLVYSNKNTEILDKIGAY